MIYCENCGRLARLDRLTKSCDPCTVTAYARRAGYITERDADGWPVNVVMLPSDDFYEMFR